MLAETIKTLDDLRDEYGRRFGDDWASSEMRTIRNMLHNRLSAISAKQYLEGEIVDRNESTVVDATGGPERQRLQDTDPARTAQRRR